MKKVILALLLLTFAAPTKAGTFTAATCGRTDVNNVINGPIHVAVDGDIIQIPAGSCTWAGAGAGITIPAGIGISIIGAGQGVTIITDQLSSAAMFLFNPTFGNSLTRLSGMTLLPTVPRTGFGNPIAINGTCTASGCPNFRVDHITMPSSWAGIGLPDDTAIQVTNMFGVVDHNIVGDVLSGSNGINFVNVGHGAWQGVGGWGDKSWASADTLGTNQAVYLEDNTFNFAFGTDTDVVVPSFGGARYVCRFNTFNTVTAATACTNHGTDTGNRLRGGRQGEMYGNHFTCTLNGGLCDTLFGYRSGVGVIFGNTLTSGQTRKVVDVTAQRTWRPNNPWGTCDGSSPWDSNDPTNPHFTGTIGSVAVVGTSYQITNSTNPGWTTNQWVGYSFHDVTKGWGYPLALSDGTSITTGDAGNSFGQNVPAPGDTYQINKVFACLDQPARGAGQLVNSTPLDSFNAFLVSTGSPGPVNEVRSPTYEFMDSGNITSDTVSIRTTPSMNFTQDVFKETINQTAQTTPTSPFNGTTGTGHGTLANRPTTCTTGVGYFATDQGSWNTSGNGFGQGQLYTCTSTNVWALYYTPFTYPHPLVTGGGTAPIIAFSPISVAFGNQNTGTVGSQTVTITNNGNASEVYSALTVSPAPFTNGNTGLAGQCAATGTLIVGGSCTVLLKFSPVATGNFSGTLTMTGTVTASVGMTGTGTNAVSIPAAPTSLTTSTSGSSAILHWVASTGTPTGYHVLRSTVSGGPYTTIATLGLTTTYTDPSLANGTYFYVVNAFNSAGTSPNSNQASATISLAPAATLNPSSLSFGVITLGTTSTIQASTLTNTGTATLSAISVASPSGPNAPDFTITSNTCGATLAVGASCTISVTFTPSLVGAEIASIIVTSNDPNGPDTISLSGTGAGAVTVSPLSVNFGNTYIHKTSQGRLVVFTNNSASTVTFTSIALTTGTQYSIVNGCGGTLAGGGASCVVTVTFAPTLLGTQTDTLTFAFTGAAGSPIPVSLTGTGATHKVRKGVTM